MDSGQINRINRPLSYHVVLVLTIRDFDGIGDKSEIARSVLLPYP